MRRRLFLLALLPAFRAPAEAGKDTLRGKLKPDPAKPYIATSDGKRIFVEGDQPTNGVLRDQRLFDAGFEAIGRLVSPDRLVIDPIHTKAIFVHKDGKRLLITYWCEVCSIRTYTPGLCWCCQQETQLDLRETIEQ